MLTQEFLGYPVIFWILAIPAYSYTLFNGFLDGGNAVATLIASRAMKPKSALRFAALIELVSPMTLFLTGFGVSKTIQGMVYEENYIGVEGLDQKKALCFIAAGILSAVIWQFTAWVSKVPSSSTHALVGGIVGSSLVAYGFTSVNWVGFLERIILMIFLAPVIGFTMGFVVMRLCKTFAKSTSTVANSVFKRLQVMNVLLLSYSHSSHDSQKTIGVIMLLMAVCGKPVKDGNPPWLIVLIAGVCLCLGILLGGYNIIKTAGLGIFKVKPIHSFSSQLASAATLITANLLKVPVASSHVISTSIMGVGSAERMNAVRWINVKRIVISWFITVPIAGSLGALFCLILRLVFKV